MNNVNRAPTAPNTVTVTPVTAFAREAVQLTDYDFSDPDGDPQHTDALQTRWYKRTGGRGEEMLVDYSNALEVPAEVTVPGDTLFCRVWPSDGSDPAHVDADQTPAGTPGQSADVAILNDLFAVVLSPDQPGTLDTLTATPQWLNSNLPTANVQLQWLETTNGGETEVGTGVTLGSDETARGRSFKVRATAWTDTTRAEPHYSLPLDSGEIVVGDTAPPAPEHADYDNPRPRSDDPITVLVDPLPVDPDGDPITLEYQWSRDPSFTDPEVFGNPLLAEATEVRQRWYARVRATVPDGSGRGTAVSAWHVLDSVPVGLITQDLNLAVGWNLLSLHLVPTDNPKTTRLDETTAEGLFGTLKDGAAWYWRNNPELGDARYINVDSLGDSQTLRQLRGIWLAHIPADTRSTQTTLPVDGWPLKTEQPHNENAITLYPGWNLVGVPADTDTFPDWLLDYRIVLPLWAWSNIDGQAVYTPEYADQGLKTGIGYWLFLHAQDPIQITP